MNNIPNILTILRIILSPIFLVLFFSEHLVLRSLSVVVFTIAALTDFFDGYLARKYKARSEFGNFLDPLADKILTFSGFFAFSYLRPDLFPWWALGVIIGRDFLITGLRILAKRNAKSLETSTSAKLKTAVQMVFIYIGLLSFLGLTIPLYADYFMTYLFESSVLFWLYMIVMMFTAYTGIEYLLKNKHIFRKD